MNKSHLIMLEVLIPEGRYLHNASIDLTNFTFTKYLHNTPFQ